MRDAKKLRVLKRLLATAVSDGRMAEASDLSRRITEMEALMGAGIDPAAQSYRAQTQSLPPNRVGPPVAMRGYFDKMVNSVGAMASPLFLLLVRLRLPYESGAVPSFPGLKHVSVFVDDAKAHVFIVANDGQSSALSEDEKIFPSDDFIARMKILMEAQSGV